MFFAARNAVRLAALARPSPVFVATTRRHLTNTAARTAGVKFYGGENGDSHAAPPTPSNAGSESHPPVQPLKASVHAALPPTMKSLSLFGKTVVVTGGARGLGNQMARACAEAGAKAVVIFDANAQLGEQAAAELHSQSGVPVAYCTVDVRQAEAIDVAVSDVVDRWGVPDVLVNAAGIADSNIKAEMYDPQMFRRLIDINLTGTFLMSTSVARHMIAAEKPGSIILVASMSGSIVNYPQEQSCYNASKAGVIQFGKSIAAEWAKHKIRVNCISPGYMDTALNRVAALEAQKKVWTSLTPQNRLGGVHELNGLCVYLASDASAFMTGSNLLIDGGYSCW
ncbi:hypothetical protein CP532_5022 [Ophiocordyceps camponoti-leonardi (nom. inval.)]|nr:hypothetical protein CP532_5022 [Ophiocordyceps camponoti-leonardi (nom. inval.)]